LNTDYVHPKEIVLSNNEWAVERRGGSEESRENNVIYIGRASFRMEPAPFTADEIVGPMAPSPVALDSGFDAAQTAGEDSEPPYLRLRTLIDESQVKDLESQHVPELDLTEFAVFAENTGVEVIRRDAPAMPHTLIADFASFPHAMPTGVEPLTELVEQTNRRLYFSRPRLVGWGALAFCAGLVASAGAHMIAAPARLGGTANAASAPAVVHAAPTAPAATTPVAAPVSVPAPAAVPLVVAEPVKPASAHNETEAPAAKLGAPEGAGAESSLAIAMPSPVRTRSGATAQSRAQTRARGKMRSLPRGGATATASDSAVTDSKPASDDTASDDQPAAPPAAHPKAHQGASWVDPFAE
jgi:hypothetical protein